MKIYTAGPLFTQAERAFNSHLASCLRKAGFTVLSPQETEPRHEGLEISQRIFLSNKELIDEADIVLANMDGPDVDSGTAWECGYAFGTDTPVFSYRTDFRNCGDCGEAQFNLMLWHSSTCMYSSTDIPTTDIAQGIARKLAELFLDCKSA